jgi:hypothetical protein
LFAFELFGSIRRQVSNHHHPILIFFNNLIDQQNHQMDRLVMTGEMRGLGLSGCGCRDISRGKSHPSRAVACDTKTEEEPGSVFNVKTQIMVVTDSTQPRRAAAVCVCSTAAPVILRIGGSLEIFVAAFDWITVSVKPLLV